MGRKPIGERAMTEAERKRRQRLMRPPAPTPPSKDEIIRDLKAELDAMERRLANRDEHIRALEARIRELEASPGGASAQAKRRTK